MALDPKYVVSIAFEQYMVDNATGLPLAGGYMEFYNDDDRITPKAVYEIAGDPPNYTYVALPNPLSLSDVGTPINNSGDQVNVYAYPYDEDGNVENYYVKVYNSEDQLQFTWRAWPNATESDNPDSLVTGYTNQLANPQFSVVNFIPEEGMTITFSGVLDAAEYEIAPGWSLVISSSGAGTVTIQKISIEGSLQIQTNPPYFISFLPTGANISSLILRQKLTNNPDIWSTTLVDNGYVSSSMLITSYDGQAHTIEMEYVQSAGPSSPQTLVTGSTGTEGYIYLTDTVLLDAGTNTDNSDEGSVYIDIVLPTIGYYGLTSLQVVGVGQDNIVVDFQQEPVNRQKSQLFYYYQPQLNFKPIKSYLCGWDFPLNPGQINGYSYTLGAYASNYIWDQTIGWQSVNSSMAVTRGIDTNVGCFTITANNTSQFAIVQYLTVPEIIEIINNPLSSNIVLSCDQASMVGTISLWYTEDSTLPNINTDNKSLILTLGSDGKPSTFNGNWTEIPRSDLGDAIFTLSSSVDLNDIQNFGFNGWQADLDTDIGAITYFAIVVGFSSLTSGKKIVIQSCSLVPGYIPTNPAPQTSNQVLKDCEYYYEKSYESATVAGTVTNTGAIRKTMSASYQGSQQLGYATGFSVEYKTEKVSLPIFTMYDPADGTADKIEFFAGNSYAGITFSSYFYLYSESVKNINFNQGSSSAAITLGDGAYSSSPGILYHYVADSRLGVY